MRVLSFPGIRLCPLLLAAAMPASLAAQALPAPMPAAAVDAPARDMAWYTVEVPVRSQERRERDAALGRALAHVVVRVTGRADAPTDPVIQRALRIADTFVLATDYRVVEETAGGVPVQSELLVASFDPDAVDGLAVAAGLPLWAGERPRPMLWLAIDDGGGAGPRLVSAQQINVVKPLAERGLERGLRFLLPAGSAVEQPSVGSIWSLDAPAMAVLSGRYEARYQLLGKLSRATAGGWQAEWLLAVDGRELARWGTVDPSPQRAIASGADRSADALAARQSTVIAAGAPEVVEAEIVGISGEGRWLGLATYLQSLPVLRAYDIVEAQPDRVRVRLDLAVDRARFEALLATGNMMAVEPDDPGVPLVRYRVLP